MLNASRRRAYHGMKFCDTFGPIAYIIKCRVDGLRDLGPCISPFNSFLFLQGIETLGMRMDRHVQNSLAVAKYLEAPAGRRGSGIPSLPSSPYHALAQKYLPKGRGRGLLVWPQGRIRSRQAIHRQLRRCSRTSRMSAMRAAW